MSAAMIVAALLPSMPAAAGQSAVEEQEIVVRVSLARAEIERILQADNLDTQSTSPRDVATAMARIRHGHAPDDFWKRYQAHVHAWEIFADATADPRSEHHEVVEAERALNSTFDTVERIARRYGARIPKPRVVLKRST